MQTAAQRPTGVTIIAILAIIGGVLGILGSIAIIGIGGAVAVGTTQTGAGGMAVVYGVIGLILSIASLVFGIGAWTLKPWAWTLGVGLEAVSIIWAIIQAIIGGTGISAGLIIGIAINAIILYYLFTPAVQRAFGRSA